jgi:hypothetical protein
MTNSTSKHIETLYRILNQHMDSVEAKTVVSEILYNAISELQEEGRPISEEEIELKLSKKVKDYHQASKTQVA